jgi:protein-tyrosine-phosphatase
MNVEQTASLERRAALHASLAEVTRLRIVDLLSASDASSSELAVATGMPSNLLAHHLKVLEHAGLIVRRRSEGDARRSYLSLRTAEVTVDPDRAVLASPRRVLFVCTANTARSHLAAALWRRASPIAARSAGTHPGERIAPGALAAAARHKLVLPDVAPRRLDDTMRAGDLVITVCDRAHEELGSLGWAHWSIPDPVPDGTNEAFEAAYEGLAVRVNALAHRLAKAS